MNFEVIKESWKKYHGFHKNIKQNNGFQHVSWAANQHIRMISEESCDTEDWSNDAENSAMQLQEEITF